MDQLLRNDCFHLEIDGVSASRHVVWIEVSDIEIQRAGPSHTVETLRAIAVQRPGTRLALILGADQWAEFGQWHEPREIASIAKLAVITRAGDCPSDLDSGFADGPPPPTAVVPVTRIDLSATLIRSRVREGLSVRYLVPESVRRIIEANNLYLNGV